VGSVDATLHGTSRRCNGSRHQVDRWALRWCEHSICGWLDDGNLAGDDTRAQSRSNDDAVMGGKPAHARRWAEAL
jgi:hypothetical protein